jgi:hypothetical protein
LAWLGLAWHNAAFGLPAHGAGVYYMPWSATERTSLVFLRITQYLCLPGRHSGRQALPCLSKITFPQGNSALILKPWLFFKGEMKKQIHRFFAFITN